MLDGYENDSWYRYCENTSIFAYGCGYVLMIFSLMNHGVDDS